MVFKKRGRKVYYGREGCRYNESAELNKQAKKEGNIVQAILKHVCKKNGRKSIKITRQSVQILVSMFREVFQKIIHDSTHEPLLPANKTIANIKCFSTATRLYFSVPQHVQTFVPIFKNATEKVGAIYRNRSDPPTATVATTDPLDSVTIVKPSFMKNRIRSNYYGKVSKIVSVYLASVCQTLISIVLNLSIDATLSSGRNMITPIDIKKAIDRDEGLFYIFGHITIPGCGFRCTNFSIEY
eukprot:gene8507-10458_t